MRMRKKHSRYLALLLTVVMVLQFVVFSTQATWAENVGARLVTEDTSGDDQNAAAGTGESVEQEPAADEAAAAAE